MGHGSSLAGGVGGVAIRAAEVPGGAHRMSARRPRLPHRDVATDPGAGMLGRVAGSRVLWPVHLEQVQDVLGACCSPQGEQVMPYA